MTERVEREVRHLEPVFGFDGQLLEILVVVCENDLGSNARHLLEVYRYWFEGSV